ncbi:MAG: AraC family transcriptional regulator [Bacteroidales bacterium]|nr:AraC family transcriptional regulator [Bacteroidales bacterium]
MDSISVKDMKVPGAVEISPGRLSVVEGIGSKAPKEYSFPLRFEIAAILICRQGVVRLVLNDHSITFRSNELLLINPDSVLEQFENKSGICDITLIMIAEAERFRSVVIDRQLWDMMLYLRRRPVIRLGKDDLELADVYKRLIELLMKSQKEQPYNDQVLNSLADVFLFQLLNLVGSKLPSSSRTVEPVPGQELFFRFLDVLKEGKGQIRSVEQMADRLCVSPKYLARIVRVNSGMTPSQWMDEYTMRSAIHELRHCSKPIKDIALSLGFPNPSGFGTFFRRHSGFSPAVYRQKNL